MNKYTFETAGVYYSHIFHDVAIVWVDMDDLDHSIWVERGRPSKFVAPRKQIKIGPTLGL